MVVKALVVGMVDKVGEGDSVGSPTEGDGDPVGLENSETEGAIDSEGEDEEEAAPVALALPLGLEDGEVVAPSVELLVGEGEGVFDTLTKEEVSSKDDTDTEGEAE